MKKILSLLALMMLCVVGVNAEKVIYSWPDGTEQANSITLADGVTVAITGNTSKNIQNGNKITVNGTEYISMKVSNGAQNTLTLPKEAIGITFYSYVNKDEATNRAPYWKEVAGVSYTEETSGGTMTSYKDGTNPDVRSFSFDATKEITFTNTGEQLCYVMEVEYAEEGGTDPVTEATYTVAGNSEAIFGTAWDPAATANDMVKGADGIYTKVYEGVELTNAYKVEYKVVENHSWDVAYGKDGQNADYTVWEGDGKYNVTFTFNPETKAVACAMTKQTVEPVLNTYTATFTTNAGWEDVYAYAWSGDGDTATPFLGAWPGTKLEAAEGVYTVEIKAEAAPEKIIFNNGKDGDEKQKTEDLAFENGKAYTYEVAVVGIIPDGTYYVMAANEGTVINAEGALDSKGTPITFTFDATAKTYTIAGADFFAGKQWTIAEAVEGVSGYYTISNADGFVAASATKTLEQIADGTAEAAVWILLQQAYWEDIANSTYTIVGTKNLTGTENDWDLVDANQMKLNDKTGLFEKTYKKIAVNSENQPEFKVVKKNMDGVDTWYPEGDNWKITTTYVGGEGVYDITITFDPSDYKEIGVTAKKRIVFPENAVVFDFEAAAEAGENPDNLNGSAANGQSFYGWENANKTDSKRQDYKGYNWKEGSVLPEVCQVWRRSDRINGNVKDGGLYCPNNREFAVNGLYEGDKVFIVYDAENATEKELVWAIGTPEAGPRATATVNGVEQVSGETTIASGAEILVNSVTPADNGTGYIVFQVKKGMTIQQIAIISAPRPIPFTATFKNDADPAWEKVYAYTWGFDGETKVEQLGAWPGTELTANAETGLFEVSGENMTGPEFIIFNNNEGTETAPKAQTEDLAFVEGKEYFYWGEHEFAYQKYLVQNVKSEMFWGAGNDWGTRASLVPNAEYLKLDPIANGKYRIESQVNNGGTQYYFNGEYMDNGNPVPLTITKAGIIGYADDAETIPVYAYTIANGDNYFGWDGTSTVLGKNLAADSENALWVIVSLADAKAALAEATADDPMDATFLIEDHNFGRNNRYQNKWTMEASNQNLSGGNNTNNCAESWHSTFTLSQVLADAPAGVYALTAQGFYRQDGSDNDNLPYFYANDEKQTFPERTGTENGMDTAGSSFSEGKYTIDPIYVKVEDGGTLTIGAKLENNTNLWCIWDNFVLTYYGATATIDEVKNAAVFEKVAELYAELGKLIASDEVEIAAVATEMQGVYDANNPETITTAEAAEAAIAALEAAIEKGKGYIFAKNVLPKMKQLTESTNVYTQEAYDEYYGQWYQKYEAAELTVAEANALQDPFVVTGWHASITCDNFLLSAWDTNPDFQDAAYYINTWSVEGENDGSNFKVPFFEYWTGDDNSLGEKTLTATMNGLTAGWYDVTAQVRVRAKNGYTAPAYGIKMQANDGDMTNVAAGDQIGESQFYMATFTAKGEVGEDGVLKIKFIVAADNNISWLSFQNVNYAAGEPVEYHYTLVGGYSDEGGVDDPVLFGTTWDPTIEKNDLKDEDGDGIYTLEMKGVQLVPGTKVLYKVVRSHSWDISWGFNGGNADYVVNLPEGKTLPEGREKGVFDVTFFFNPTAVLIENGYNVHCVMTYDEETTGISSIAADAQNGTIYNLNGQKVMKTQKGLYIINGRKQVVK